MGILLSINSFHKFTSEIKSEFSFNDSNIKSSIKFGRSDSCDWQLPDPERVVSSIHGEVIKCGNDYLIRDLSTNGLFLNRSVTPLGNNNEIKLNDNDVITFGEYEIHVNMVFESSCPTIAPHKKKPSEPEFPVSSEGYGVDIDKLLSSEPNHDALFETDLGLADDYFGVQEMSNEEPVQQMGSKVNHQSDIALQPSYSEAVFAEDDMSAQGLAQGGSQYHESKSTEIHAKPLAANTSALAMNAFLQGVGISKQMVPSHNSEQWFHQLGQSFSLLLGGLMDTLHHRAEFKQSNRLNHTAFQRNENNPLKFSANVEDAIHNLYNRNSASFLGPKQSILEAFADIEKHERALMMGVGGAVDGVMSLLEPNYIAEQNSSQGVLEKLLLGKSQANYWKGYERTFFELKSELDEGTHPFYLEDFAKSYEMALKKN